METDLSRYSAIDDYTLEELIREYQFAIPRERISLVSRLYGQGIMPPYELALMAVEDEHPLVRQWMARHARHLDYNDDPQSYREQRDLKKTLANDQDIFIRACLYENPFVFEKTSQQDWFIMFGKVAHMERLAMVRNPVMQRSQILLEAIFDVTNQDFELTLNEREELASALLFSRQALTAQHRKGQSFVPELWDTRLFSRLWRLINKWPADSKLKNNIHLYIGTTIRTKAGVYRQCKQAAFRADILRGIEPDDHETIELGMRDEEDRCRFFAYSKVRDLTSARFASILENDDVHALLGLAENESLTTRLLEAVKDRLFALGAHEQARWATESIERAKQQGSASQPDKLFSDRSLDQAQLSEKINTIGNLLLSLRRKVNQLEQQLEASETSV